MCKPKAFVTLDMRPLHDPTTVLAILQHTVRRKKFEYGPAEIMGDVFPIIWTIEYRRYPDFFVPL